MFTGFFYFVPGNAYLLLYDKNSKLYMKLVSGGDMYGAPGAIVRILYIFLNMLSIYFRSFFR